MMVVLTFDHCLSRESGCYDLGICWHNVPILHNLNNHYGELESCFSLVHLSDLDDDLEHVVSVS
jgi:hypothetical protein